MPASGCTEDTLRGAAIGLMVVTTITICSRAVLRVDRNTFVQWDEIWLFVGYLLFMTVTSVYISKAGVLFRILDVEEGRLAPYPSLAEDEFHEQKTFFFTNPGLWFTLWSVKFSLLAFYKRIMAGIKSYENCWWAVLSYCVISLVVVIVLHITACGPSPSLWFDQDGCSADDARQPLISFWAGFTADLTTDLMIMILPIGVIRNLHIPIVRKMQICTLFGLGLLVVIASIIRVIQVGTTIGPKRTTPAGTWLALWSIVESSVAIIVGCGPGLYRKAKSVRSNTPSYAYNSRGYIKTSDSRRANAEKHSEELYGLPINTKISGRSSEGSKEELIENDGAGKITVTKSVTVH
ncbi:hypothetical protein GGP41_001818 [Bipolaris sorokiniana]|uniref:Rhodopsin domain-containing protein n=2 Tax=Cochliobolus sativus TaxID=45130 RepID=A0A8H6E0C1_COCSA|nr:uncharacterized protein COCSADRAFT_133817 [Bipolaris sorokiniana ND90Pr]EMD68273.1 hypothetical protein COCSADRAFT_133817 [Bipolaris sorokiniana ND90Pr]KAF5853275.1 hypothetical protein GGP41_001818 [Bipolaris sorokiniana]